MSEWALRINLDDEIFEKPDLGTLCIARKVCGKFTIVFQDGAIKPDRSGQRLLRKATVFEWKDEFRITAVTTLASQSVESVANTVDIKFGQGVYWNKNEFSKPQPESASTFGGYSTIRNSFVAAYVPSGHRIKVRCMLDDSTWACNYVDPDKDANNIRKVVTMHNEYLLFWSRTHRKGSTIDDASDLSGFRFSYIDGEHYIKLRYGYAIAGLPEDGEKPNFWYVM